MAFYFWLATSVLTILLVPYMVASINTERPFGSSIPAVWLAGAIMTILAVAVIFLALVPCVAFACWMSGSCR